MKYKYLNNQEIKEIKQFENGWDIATKNKRVVNWIEDNYYRALCFFYQIHEASGKAIYICRHK